MAINFMLPLRIAQALFAIIALGLTGYVVSWFNTDSPSPSPSQINFLIFVAVWTAFLAVPYLALSPRYYPAAAHKFAILGVEALTMIFWFAGFVAAAVWLGSLLFCRGMVCGASRGAVVFGAFEWVLFTATTMMASIHVLRSRNEGYGNNAKNLQHYNGL